MADDEKKVTAAFKLQQALAQYADEIMSESGNLSAQTKEELEKFIAAKLSDVDSALGKEKQETRREMEAVNKKMFYLEKLVSGEFEQRKTIEQNNQSKVNFSNNFDFVPTAVKFVIGGKEYIAQIAPGGEIAGEKIISGNIGIAGDGNQQGQIKFDGVLDPSTKIEFLGKNKGVLGQLEEIRVMLRNIELSQKENAIQIGKLDTKIKIAAEALK